MTVNLAGFNVDLENIKAVKTFCENGINKEEIQKLNWTPETISASYARISRDERQRMQYEGGSASRRQQRGARGNNTRRQAREARDNKVGKPSRKSGRSGKPRRR